MEFRVWAFWASGLSWEVEGIWKRVRALRAFGLGFKMRGGVGGDPPIFKVSLNPNLKP